MDFCSLEATHQIAIERKIESRLGAYFVYMTLLILSIQLKSILPLIFESCGYAKVS